MFLTLVGKKVLLGLRITLKMFFLSSKPTATEKSNGVDKLLQYIRRCLAVAGPVVFTSVIENDRVTNEGAIYSVQEEKKTITSEINRKQDKDLGSLEKTFERQN